MAKKEEFTFLSADRTTKIHVMKWVPDDGKITASLQIAHGMCEHIERYEEFANYAADHGIMVIGNSHLGHGKSVKSSENYGYFGENKKPSDLVIEDMNKVRWMCQRGKPHFMMGHSMGSYMLRKYLSIYGEGLSGAILMGTGYVPQIVTEFGICVAKIQGKMFGSKHRSELLRKLSYSKPYRKFDSYGHDYSKSWLTRDVEEVKKYFEDPACNYTFTCNGYLGLFEAVNYSCKKENADKIPKDLPILLISGDDDPVGDLGVGVKKVAKLYRSVGISDVQLKMYRHYRHEILHELNKDEVFRDIISWLKSEGISEI